MLQPFAALQPFASLQPFAMLQPFATLQPFFCDINTIIFHALLLTMHIEGQYLFHPIL